VHRLSTSHLAQTADARSEGCIGRFHVDVFGALRVSGAGGIFKLYIWLYDVRTAIHEHEVKLS